MISITHTDHYAPPGPDGEPRKVVRYGIGIRTDRRSYGRRADGTPETDKDGADGADTIDAVMLDTGTVETFDVSAVEVLETK